jgi:gamma-glutamyltranspeptidase/glutathione hydrolase
MLVTSLAAVLLAVLFAARAQADSKPVHAPHAIVVSIDELASKAGADIMQEGGNAIDAAVATGFALAVVYPQAGNLGGGGFMLIRMADGRTHFIDFREEAPASATANMYVDAQGNVIDGASEYGYKAIGVPGSVAGLVYAQ